MTDTDSFSAVKIRAIRHRELEDVFMKTAIEFSKMSTCARVEVGGVLVKNKRIVSCGFNGVPKGMLHCKDYFLGREVDNEEHRIFSSNFEVHCEQNILVECLKNGINPEGGIMYLTLSPCNMCAKLMVAAGVKEVLFLERYDREVAGIDLLNNNGIPCHQYTIGE